MDLHGLRNSGRELIRLECRRTDASPRLQPRACATPTAAAFHPHSQASGYSERALSCLLSNDITLSLACPTARYHGLHTCNLPSMYPGSAKPHPPVYPAYSNIFRDEFITTAHPCRLSSYRTYRLGPQQIRRNEDPQAMRTRRSIPTLQPRLFSTASRF